MTLTMTHLFAMGNILYCFSYLVRDILWLRLLAILAATSSLPYFYLQPEPLLWPIFWQASFLLVNLVHASFLIYERMPVALSEKETRLRTLAFRTLNDRELLRVSQSANWYVAEEGEVLLQKGEVSTRLIMVFHGVLEVRDDTRRLAHLMDGQFAGEMSLISGKPHSADVVAVEPTEYLAWDMGALSKLWQRNPNIKKIFDTLIGLDMVEKLSDAPQYQAGWGPLNIQT